MEKYDSTFDTKKHIERVNALGQDFALVLSRQLKQHDASKLSGVEKKTFDAISPLLEQFEYGTAEYTESLNAMRQGIDEHYKNNSHHPEHFPNGIAGMNMFDIVEMLLDWKAACERTKGGDIKKSLEIQMGRFNIPIELHFIFLNTVVKMGW